MRSFPNMIDMKRSTADISGEAQGLIMPTVSDLPDYDYGLNGSFNRESLDKLNLDDEVHVGDMICITAMAKVTCVHQKPGETSPDGVDFVMTNIDAEENEDEAA